MAVPRRRPPRRRVLGARRDGRDQRARGRRLRDAARQLARRVRGRAGRPHRGVARGQRLRRVGTRAERRRSARARDHVERPRVGRRSRIRALDTWTDYFRDLGVGWITEGAVLLHRRDGSPHSLRADPVDGGRARERRRPGRARVCGASVPDDDRRRRRPAGRGVRARRQGLARVAPRSARRGAARRGCCSTRARTRTSSARPPSPRRSRGSTAGRACASRSRGSGCRAGRRETFARRRSSVLRDLLELGFVDLADGRLTRCQARTCLAPG